MDILLGFAPFIAFFVLLRVSAVAGLAAAALVSLLLCVRMWRRGESVKILEVGSLLLFAALVLYTLVTSAEWTIASARLAVDAGLFLIVLASLAIGRPFTIQYAREQVAPELWSSPIFIRTNQRITAAWAAAFGIMMICDAAAEYVPAVPVSVDIAVSVAAFVGAVWFTRWYPAVVRRRAQAAGAR